MKWTFSENRGERKVHPGWEVENKEDYFLFHSS
jgi:hypothetical protein